MAYDYYPEYEDLAEVFVLALNVESRTRAQQRGVLALAWYLDYGLTDIDSVYPATSTWRDDLDGHANHVGRIRWSESVVDLMRTASEGEAS